MGEVYVKSQFIVIYVNNIPRIISFKRRYFQYFWIKLANKLLWKQTRAESLKLNEITCRLSVHSSDDISIRS